MAHKQVSIFHFRSEGLKRWALLAESLPFACHLTELSALQPVLLNNKCSVTPEKLNLPAGCTLPPPPPLKMIQIYLLGGLEGGVSHLDQKSQCASKHQKMHQV